MIVSFKHKLIFIAIPKTAGHAIRNGLRPLMAHHDWEQCGLFEKKSFPISELAKLGHGHLTARQIEAHLPPGTFEDFFSFAYIRNPYDRFVSFSAFINRDNDKMKCDALGTMKASLSNPNLLLHILMRPQMEFITDPDGHIMVSHLARYENIQDEFDYIRSRAGAEPFALPQINVSKRTSYAEYYDDELQQMVAHHYAKDFDALDYNIKL